MLFGKRMTPMIPVSDVLGPRLAVIFQRLIRLGNFSVFWRVANVTPIPKGSPSSSVANYRRISLTPKLSNVFERLVSVGLWRFMGCRSSLTGKVLALVMPSCVCGTYFKLRVFWRWDRRLELVRSTSVLV